MFRQSKRLDFIRHFMCFLSLQKMCLKENTARRTRADLRRSNGVLLWNCVPNTYNSHMLLHMNVILFLPCLIILLVITFGSYSYGWNSAPVYF